MSPKLEPERPRLSTGVPYLLLLGDKIGTHESTTTAPFDRNSVESREDKVVVD